MVKEKLKPTKLYKLNLSSLLARSHAVSNPRAKHYYQFLVYHSRNILCLSKYMQHT